MIKKAEIAKKKHKRQQESLLQITLKSHISSSNSAHF